MTPDGLFVSPPQSPPLFRAALGPISTADRVSLNKCLALLSLPAVAVNKAALESRPDRKPASCFILIFSLSVPLRHWPIQNMPSPICVERSRVEKRKSGGKKRIKKKLGGYAFYHVALLSGEKSHCCRKWKVEEDELSARIVERGVASLNRYSSIWHC